MLRYTPIFLSIIVKNAGEEKEKGRGEECKTMERSREEREDILTCFCVGEYQLGTDVRRQFLEGNASHLPQHWS